jgi:hypothetical protein
MFTHTSSQLQGPITRDRPWWTADAGPEPTELQLVEDQPIRTELVERIRREIAEGTYDTPEKWEIALDRLLDRLDP